MKTLGFRCQVLGFGVSIFLLTNTYNLKPFLHAFDLPVIALASVTSSAYSMSAPIGRPRARRVIDFPNGES